MNCVPAALFELGVAFALLAEWPPSSWWSGVLLFVWYAVAGPAYIGYYATMFLVGR